MGLKKNKREKCIKQLVFCIITVLLMISTTQIDFSTNKGSFEDEFNLQKRNEVYSAEYHPPISIDGNTQLDAFPNKTGLGTALNPYVIRDLIIDGGGFNPTCVIENTDKYLRIENCTFFDSSSFGIWIYSGSNVVINGSYAHHNAYEGFVTSFSSNINITNNIALYNSRNGIYWSYCEGAPIIISGNNISYNNWDGLNIACTSNAGQMRVENNTIENNLQNGIEINGAHSLTIKSNTITSNAINGIFLNGPDNCEIHQNNATYNEYGIYLVNSPQNNNITYNLFINNTIDQIYATPTDYSNNEIHHNEEDTTPEETSPHFYDFEDDTIGQLPSGSTFEIIEFNPAAGSISVETLGDSQGNCLLLDKVTDADWIAIRDNLSYMEGPNTNGTVKFKFYKTDYAGFQFRLYGQFKAIAALAFYNGEVRSYSQAGWFYSDPYVLLTTYQNHQWYQVQIDFDVNLGYTFILNGEKYGSGYTIPLSESDPGTYYFALWSSCHSGGGLGDFYVDDIEFTDGSSEIYTNTLVIISPVGIDSWDIGCEYDITWTSTSIMSTVDIELYKEGIFEREITSGETNDGRFSWTIPFGLVDSPDYQIKITDSGNSSLFAFSDYFEIKEPVESLSLTSPTSDDSWKAGSIQAISWNSEGDIEQIHIELYKDGVFYRIIVSDFDVTDGSYSWIIPTNLESSTHYIIKIVNADNTQVYDYSEEFEIIGQEELWVVLAIGGIAVVLAGSTTGIVLGIRHYRRRKHLEQVIKQNYETEMK